MISGINRTYKPNIKHIYYYSQSKNPVAINSVNLEIVPEYPDSFFRLISQSYTAKTAIAILSKRHTIDYWPYIKNIP